MATIRREKKGGERERRILSIARGKRVFTPVVDELNLINYVAKRAASIVSWDKTISRVYEVQLASRGCPNSTPSVIVVLFKDIFEFSLFSKCNNIYVIF